MRRYYDRPEVERLREEAASEAGRREYAQRQIDSGADRFPAWPGPSLDELLVLDGAEAGAREEDTIAAIRRARQQEMAP